MDFNSSSNAVSDYFSMLQIENALKLYIGNPKCFQIIRKKESTSKKNIRWSHSSIWNGFHNRLKKERKRNEYDIRCKKNKTGATKTIKLCSKTHKKGARCGIWDTGEHIIFQQNFV